MYPRSSQNFTTTSGSCSSIAAGAITGFLTAWRSSQATPFLTDLSSRGNGRNILTLWPFH